MTTAGEVGYQDDSKETGRVAAARAGATQPGGTRRSKAPSTALDETI